MVANGAVGQWYLNDGFGNGYCDGAGCHYAMWTLVYLNEPLAGTNLTAEEEKLVIGGEASLWGEEIDSSNLMSKAWPRGAAFAERMWSPQDFRPAEAQLEDAAPRLARFTCKMSARGLPVSPLGPGSCDHW